MQTSVAVVDQLHCFLLLVAVAVSMALVDNYWVLFELLKKELTKVEQEDAENLKTEEHESRMKHV